MSDWETVLLIILVVGIIASNLVVLKHTAKFKMHQFGNHKDKSVKTKDKRSEDKAEQDKPESQTRSSKYPKYKEWDDDKDEW